MNGSYWRKRKAAIKSVMTKVIPLWAASTLVHAQDLCPPGPFETDSQAIAATMAAEPLQPLEWYADRAIGGQMGVTDGAWERAGGGLGGNGQFQMWSDAKHYVSVYLDTEWPPPPGSFMYPSRGVEPPPLMSNQLVRKIPPNTYTLTVGRPTLEEAREFACLANQLLIPEPKPPPVLVSESGNEVTVTARRRRPSCEVWMSDAAYDYY